MVLLCSFATHSHEFELDVNQVDSSQEQLDCKLCQPQGDMPKPSFSVSFSHNAYFIWLQPDVLPILRQKLWRTFVGQRAPPL